MMTLAQFIEASGIQLNRNDYKVHLAVPSGNDSPLDAFFRGEFDDWQGVQNQRNFQCEHVVSLINLSANKWLFVGVYNVDSIEDYEHRYWYNLSLLPNQGDLIGRVIVHYTRTSRSSYRIGHTIEDECILGEILPERMSIASYPGHNNVIVNYTDLSTIIGQKEPTWYGALSNVKGIYCISDLISGKQYIGKADGQDGIWQRWTTYVNNGHGDNKELKQLLKEKGLDYKQNFQFSLIEIADFRTPDEEIDKRESHWKQVLLTREFGYNAN